MTLLVQEYRAKQLNDGKWAKERKNNSNNKNSAISGLTEVS